MSAIKAWSLLMRCSPRAPNGVLNIGRPAAKYSSAFKFVPAPLHIGLRAISALANRDRRWLSSTLPRA